MLEDYNRKRDFEKTPEPRAKTTPGKGDLKFVIQKHSARRLHYDVRLELDGVLMSWAVPKGPSVNPADKRLAVHTEDHPIDYDLFEGMIPMGEYGGGPMIIWDRGTYSPDDEGETSWGNRDEAQQRLREGMKKGKISIFFRGEKLQGSFTLFRLSSSKKDEWLMLKHKDEYTSTVRDVTKEDRSVVSGRTVEEVKANKPAAQPSSTSVKIDGAREIKFPTELTPMAASLTDGPFNQDGWIYEPKLDGIRAIAMVRQGAVTLTSRNGLDLTDSYPLVVQELSNYNEDLIFDGELIALDDKGRPSFQVLQQRSGLTRPADVNRAEAAVPVYFYVFDLLYAAKQSLEGVVLKKRKELLKQFLVKTDHVRLVEPLAADGLLAYQACVEIGLEGIVAKRLDSTYERGRRAKSWLKVKPTMSADFVIGGFTEGTGSRGNTFGSLLLGYYSTAGELMYAGGCGTGFNDAKLQNLLKEFESLEQTKSPFKGKIPGKGNHWLEPKLVVEVKFSEWTRDLKVRTPVFVRLRDDKNAKDCTRDEIIHEVKEPKSEEKVVHKPENDSVRAEVIDLETKRSAKQKTKEPEMSADENVVKQLEDAGEKLILEVEGTQISYSNLNKQLWPGTEKHGALTKRDYAIYLAKIAPWLLPHMKDRPLTCVRFPNGIGGVKFYQKHWEKGLPDFVERHSIFVEHSQAAQEFVVCNNLPTLLWLAQIADLELHTWQARINPGPDGFDKPRDYTTSVETLEQSLLNYPDYLLFDLDPYTYSGKEKHGDEPELNLDGFKQCVRLAKWLKELFDTIGIDAFIKTTGKTGLHIYIPIVREFTFDEVRALSGTIGQIVLKQHSNDVTMDWAIVKRKGKTFLDHNMNGRGKTLASIYSARVSPEAAVSVPVSWDDLDDIYPTDFTMHSVPELVKKRGDLWADILDHKNDLGKMMTKKDETSADKKPTKRRRKTS